MSMCTQTPGLQRAIPPFDPQDGIVGFRGSRQRDSYMVSISEPSDVMWGKIDGSSARFVGHVFYAPFLWAKRELCFPEKAEPC